MPQGFENCCCPASPSARIGSIDLARTPDERLLQGGFDKTCADPRPHLRSSVCPKTQGLSPFGLQTHPRETSLFREVWQRSEPTLSVLRGGRPRPLEARRGSR